MNICSVEGCESPSEKRGWCQKHYRTWQRHGDTQALKKKPNGSGCIYIDDSGYFRVQFGKKCWPLHRMIMEAIVGRPLLSHEVVHHIDHDKKNNHPDNLQLMSRPVHISIHHKSIADNGINSEILRYCKSCNSVKSVEAFYPDKKESFGRRHTCIDCSKRRSKERYMAKQEPKR